MGTACRRLCESGHRLPGQVDGDLTRCDTSMRMWESGWHTAFVRFVGRITVPIVVLDLN